MTSGRPRVAIGTFGSLDLSFQASSWRARVWVQDLDGKRRRVQATASSQRKAEAALQEKLTRRPGYGGAGVLGVSGFGAPFDHVQQPRWPGPVADGGQVDDHGDVLVAAVGVPPQRAHRPRSRRRPRTG